MSLPKSVQRQLDAAEAAASVLAAVPQPVVVNDPSQLTAAPAPTAPAQPPEPAPVPPPPTAPAENWEHKFKTLQGRVAAQIPELQAREAALTSRVTALTDQLAALTRAAPPKQETTVDPRDAQQFGEDMVEMVLRNARHLLAEYEAKFADQARALDERIKAVENKVSGVAQRTEMSLEETFYAFLDDQVPDWQTVNVSQPWLTWLAEIDPVYGFPRQAALDSAFEKRDGKRVAAIFKQFKADTKVKAPPPLEQQITPSSGGSGVPPAPPAAAKQMLSQKFVQNFYTDVAKGRYAQKPDEQARIENEINLAAQEGRIL